MKKKTYIEKDIKDIYKNRNTKREIYKKKTYKRKNIYKKIFVLKKMHIIKNIRKDIKSYICKKKYI